MDESRARQLLEAEAGRLVEVERLLVAEHLDAVPESDAVGELSSQDQHQADVASDVFEREKEYSLLGRVRADLVDVQDALDRLGRHDFGRCQSCGAAIPDDRLEAMPATRFCVDHEGYWEAVRMTLTPMAGYVPRERGMTIERLVELAALLNLDLLSPDDELDENLLLSQEEAAIHLTGPGTGDTRLDAQQVEDIEARFDEEESADRGVAHAEDAAWQEAVEAAAGDEERLDTGN